MSREWLKVLGLIHSSVSIVMISEMSARPMPVKMIIGGAHVFTT